MLDRETIRQSPAVVADDVLRQMPTFSLFRRTSSLSSHPTAQGVSLRGIGPSGVSRTLVLLDGVPFNDPFGGWVYWTRVPLESVDRIEVVDGLELEPVRQLRDGRRHQHRDRAAGAPDGRAQAAVRQPRTARRSTSSAATCGARSASTVDGSVFNTDGFPIVVAEPSAAPVDNNATVNFQQRQRQARLRRRPTGCRRSSAAGYFSEDRDNGKVSTIDGTRKPTTRGGRRSAAACASGCPTRAICRRACSPTSRRSTATSSRCPPPTPPRSIGRMTLNQTRADQRRRRHGAVVAARSARSQYLQRRHRLALGRRRQRGGRPRRRATGTHGRRCKRVSGGTQRSLGAFVQDIFTPTAEADGDAERARRSAGATTTAHNLETNVPTGMPTANNTPTLPGSRRHRRQPARRRALSPDRPRERVGRLRLRASARRRSTSCIASSASARC